MILLLLLNALFALTYPLSQQALLYGPILLVVALRMFIAAAGFLGFDAWFNKTAVSISQKDWHRLLFVGLGAMYIPFVLECWSLQQVSALQVNGIYLLNPLICALLEYWCAHQILNRRKIYALIISLVGGILFVHHQGASLSVLPTGREFCAMLAIIISMVLTAYTWFSVKKLLNKGHSLVRINGITMLIGGLASVISFVGLWTLWSQVSVVSFHPLLYHSALLALVGNIAGFTLFGILIRKYSLTFIALAQFTAPLFGIAYEYFFFGTFISIQEALSLIVIMFGVGLFYSQEQRITINPTPPVA